MKSELTFVTVVVTYGTKKRLAGVINTINAALEAGSSRVYLIDNGCSYDLEGSIRQSCSIDKIKFKRFEENQGSMVGFSSGIRKVLKDKAVSDDDYVLILDDDVILDREFAYAFEKVENQITTSDKHVWSLYRKDREHNFNTNYDRNKKYFVNSIAGFSVFRRKGSYLTKRTIKSIGSPFFIPWAGTFMRKGELRQVPLPKSDFYVYEDDAEFSLNVRDQGFEIYRSTELILREGSKSWFEGKEKPESGYKLYYQGTVPNGRFLYKIRNNVFLTKSRLMTNKVVFRVNIVIFVVAGFLRYGKFNKQGIKCFKQLYQATWLGWNGKLGKRKDWIL